MHELKFTYNSNPEYIEQKQKMRHSAISMAIGAAFVGESGFFVAEGIHSHDMPKLAVNGLIGFGGLLLGATGIKKWLSGNEESAKIASESVHASIVSYVEEVQPMTENTANLYSMYQDYHLRHSKQD